jgi:hypothetical protein
MNGRNYLDLTPTELLVRRYIVWGLGFFVMPPLLTSCHFGDYLCGAHWDGDVSPLVTVWVLFPWLLPIAFVMLGGLGMALLGGILLLLPKNAKRTGVAPIEAGAFRTCVGALIAVLLVGGFGHVVYDAMSPGFYFAPVATGRSVWLGSQALLLAVYLAGAILTLSAALREQLRWPQSLPVTADNVIG